MKQFIRRNCFQLLYFFVWNRMRMKKMSGEKKTIIFSSVKLSENKISRETFLLKKSIFMCETKFQHLFSSFLCVQNRKKTLEKNDLKISFRQIFYLYVKKMFRTNILLEKTQILPTFCPKLTVLKQTIVFTHGGKKNSWYFFPFHTTKKEYPVSSMYLRDVYVCLTCGGGFSR